MKRRGVFGGLGIVLLAPTLARAQRSTLPLVGVLSLLPEAAVKDQLIAFQRGLEETGHVGGRTVAMEYRWADGNPDLLPQLAADLARRRPAVIVAAGGNIAALAVKRATSTIPIVFTAVRDPVADGLVASLNRPGGNMTGVAILAGELDAKRLQLLDEIAPSEGPISALINRQNPSAVAQGKALEAAARTVGRTIKVLFVGTMGELHETFAALGQQRDRRLVVASDPWFSSHRTEIVELAARHLVPCIFQWRQFVEVGGLASYGPDFSEAYRQAGILTGRILRGEAPGNLPVLRPTKFEFVINRTAARALGLTVPPAVLARVDEVIE
ncbi:ABC transporter substrate-binding protein [uncultured Reyranella sp.]|uniref:ABC transporter substrate-binding protein n=1 Tax=uncultured Reyranella sp. TaxID=735512 RepID=UPI0025F0DE69|nr:ABC transporter substrate-binding protein [uncultured Reyranella sp.]